MARYGYARISTRSQRDDSQLDALRAAGCERNWTDTRPAAARAPLACPTCGREPTTRHEAVQQREDLAIVWLHLDDDRVTEARSLRGMPAARARHRRQLLLLRQRPQGPQAENVRVVV